MDTNTVNGQANTANEQAEVNTTEQTQTTSTEGTESYLKLTQKDLDNMMAKTRGATEREMLKSLGLDNKDNLAKVKEAYTNTLSAEEKLNNDLQQLQTTANTYKSQAEESAYTLAAMEAITGKSRAEVETIVKMAKGLTSEETPFETAMQTVMGLMTPAQQAVQAEQAPKPNGFNLMQPEQAVNSTKTNYETKYAEAKKAGNFQSMIAIKSEAFKNGVVL